MIKNDNIVKIDTVLPNLTSLRTVKYHLKNVDTSESKKHKKDNMVHIKYVGAPPEYICLEEDCKLSAQFNYIKESIGLYCKKHKKIDMINVIKKKCNFEGCDVIPGFNFKGKSAIYCFIHKEPDMINVNSKSCKTYLCDVSVKNKYEGYCLYCYINTFPDKPVSRNYKTKEQTVIDYILKTFPEMTLKTVVLKDAQIYYLIWVIKC